MLHLATIVIMGNGSFQDYFTFRPAQNAPYACLQLCSIVDRTALTNEADKL